MASFGDELKRERELRDISLKEISEATKISIRFLEALEQNNFDVLPGGVFNRGFIRAYARFIGVDGEEMVNAYLHEVALREARLSQSGKGPQKPGGAGASAASAGARAETRAPQRIETRASGRNDARAEIPPEVHHAHPARADGGGGRMSPALWLLVLVAVLVGAGAITMSLLSDKRMDASADDHAQAVRARMSKSDTTPAPPTAEKTPAQASPADANAGGEPPATASVADAAQPAALEPAPAAADPNAPAPGAPPAGGSTAPGDAPVVPAVPEHRLKVLALEATRVTVECGGKVSLDQELWPGQTRILACVEPVVLSAGNGGAIEYSLDDAPVALLGQLGQQIEGLVLAPAEPAAPISGPAGRAARDPNAGR